MTRRTTLPAIRRRQALWAVVCVIRGHCPLCLATDAPWCHRCGHRMAR